MSFTRSRRKVIASLLLLLSAMMFRTHHFIPGPESYEVTVLAGREKPGSRDGKAAECSFSYSRGGLAVNESMHSCYVADWGNDAIRKISFAD